MGLGHALVISRRAICEELILSIAANGPAKGTETRFPEITRDEGRLNRIRQVQRARVPAAFPP